MIPKRPRRLRADGAHDRHALIDAAKAGISDSGLNVSLDDIARRAGVGIGTLHRHFRSREAVVEAVYRREVEQLAGAVRHLLETSRAGDALHRWMHLFIDYVATKRLIAPALAAVPGGSSTLYASSTELITAAMETLVQRAAAGDIRRDTTVADLLRAMVGVCHGNPVEGWEASAHRLIDIVMDGLHRDPPTEPPVSKEFSPQDVDAVYRVIAMRRDMRHFLPDPLDEALLERLLRAAHMAPSVGFMQPWRFIRVRDRELRVGIHSLVEAERIKTARALGEREDEFMRLKVEGILGCGELLIVGLCDHREEHLFGRRTMPEMDLASVACAIQNLWLAARVESVGMGWVSLFDPEALRLLLRMPIGGRPVAILCLGRVAAFYPGPMLEEAGWARRLGLDSLVHTDYWNDQCAPGR